MIFSAFRDISGNMPAGVYIHIPFCRSRCSYCDFATDVYKNPETIERYINALTTEISRFSQDTAIVETIYFGGGTPSLLTPKQLEDVLNTIHKKFSVNSEIELTMEMNPATVSLETLKEYRNSGVNRASFGAQTFNDTELKRLGRKHTAADVRETIDLLRKSGFDNVSFDLIAGLPRQTLQDWEENLNESLKLKPEHLSLYLLEIHEGTPLAEQIRSNRQPLPDEDLSAEMYELTLDKVAEYGYSQYEISNFALPGFDSKHNSKYWLFEPVYSFGVSAHSFDGKNRRWANERDTANYVELIEAGNKPLAETNILTSEESRGEYAFLRLRLTKGLNLMEYKTRFDIDLRKEYVSDWKRLEEAGLIEFEDDNLRLTRRGMLYSNEVFAVLI